MSEHVAPPETMGRQLPTSLRASPVVLAHHPQPDCCVQDKQPSKLEHAEWRILTVPCEKMVCDEAALASCVCVSNAVNAWLIKAVPVCNTATWVVMDAPVRQAGAASQSATKSAERTVPGSGATKENDARLEVTLLPIKPDGTRTGAESAPRVPV